MAMSTSLETLCQRAQQYLISIPINNKNTIYTPSSTLANGTTIKSLPNHLVTYPGQSCYHLHIDVKTSETIPSNFCAIATNNMIINDWNDYKRRYIEPRFPDGTLTSMPSLFTFLYLFRYFVDKKFCVFTDTYGYNNVWLYNTASVSYNPDPASVSQGNFNLSNINTYMNKLISEIINRDTLKVLASSSVASCSSSSCSSSCSSSSSSSCSSSCSSSSSSVFIAYFNLN